MKGIITILLLLNVCSIYSQVEPEKEERDMFDFDGANIFKTIPPLFEYLVNILTDTPEILERNDISTFTNDTTDIHEITITSEGDSCCENDDNAFNSEDEENIKKFIKISKTFVAPILSKFSLTPEEVMEQVLIVEQQLDEYNRKN